VFLSLAPHLTWQCHLAASLLPAVYAALPSLVTRGKLLRFG
jgi:hypothetical protein